MSTAEVPHPSSVYIPETPSQETEMFDVIGIEHVDELFQDIPENIRNPRLFLPPPLTEQELAEEMRGYAAKNVILPSFLGAGTYNRFQPAVIRAILSRDEYLTSYTPYQPEVSQGTLQTGFELQTMIKELYGMEFSNTGMYDGATAMAEAALMAVRLKKQERKKIVTLDTVHPEWIDVAKTYTSGKGIELTIEDEKRVGEVSKDAAAVIVQSPNYLGNLEDLENLGKAAHGNGALFIVAADPISLGMYETPGYYGADIAVGEGRSLGQKPNLAGVNLGLFASKMDYVRARPGRIIGRTKDKQGRTGYVLTLQTQEQHIRRERATSNICTAEQLIALSSAIYLSLLGEQGLRAVAERNYQNAHYLAYELSQRGYSLPFADKEFFNEFVVTCSSSPSEVNKRLLEEGFMGGKDISDKIPNGMLLCATETTGKGQIDRFVEAFVKAA